MLIAGVGILFSIVGTFFVRISDKAGIKTSVVQNALNMGNWGSIILNAIASYFLCTFILPAGEMYLTRNFDSRWPLKEGIDSFTNVRVFGSIIVGLVVGTLMSIITEYYTAMGKRPVCPLHASRQPAMPQTLLVAWRLVWNLPFCRSLF
jgi:K(+)-stimulated pyrophosphate-energized sodium pump